MPWGTRLIRTLLRKNPAGDHDLREISSEPVARANLRRLRSILNYRIKDRNLFVQALLHRSFPQKNPHSDLSNERLEFLGDSILNMIVAEYLYRRFPRASEGELTKVRSRLVNRKALAAYARRLRLSDAILMSPSAAQAIGKGYETIVSDTFEAVVAALYLDGGFRVARRFVEQQLEEAVHDGTVLLSDDNYKSRLLEFAQSRGLGVPRYTIVKQEGPDHDRTFTVDVFVKNTLQGSGSGKNKKEAEQAAASNALAHLR
jgi:ribonuclease-3